MSAETAPTPRIVSWHPVSRFLIRRAGFPAELLPEPSAALRDIIQEWQEAETATARTIAEFDFSVAALVGKADPGPARQQAARLL